jgi:endonuclease-3 related protein
MSENPLIRVFDTLKRHFGPLHWWPAESPFEVAVGAILTQNTAWTNVEKAIANLRAANVLSPLELQKLAIPVLEDLIKPAGFFRQKARYLHQFTNFLVEHCGGDIATLCAGPLNDVRQRLLALKGVGPETADSILLYAAERPSFVIDAYTRRIFSRLGILQGKQHYETIRRRFMEALPHETKLFNEYHALIVELAKTVCRKNSPACDECPLLSSCPYGQDEGTRDAGRGTRQP